MKVTNKISEKQTASLHVYCRQLAEMLAENDYDFRDLRIELKPTENLVKEYMWKPVQEALFGKKSTKDLTKEEVSEVYEHLNRALSERFGVYVPWPEKPKKQ